MMSSFWGRRVCRVPVLQKQASHCSHGTIYSTRINNNTRTNSVLRTHHCQPTFAHSCIVKSSTRAARQGFVVLSELDRCGEQRPSYRGCHKASVQRGREELCSSDFLPGTQTSSLKRRWVDHGPPHRPSGSSAHFRSAGSRLSQQSPSRAQRGLSL